LAAAATRGSIFGKQERDQVSTIVGRRHQFLVAKRGGVTAGMRIRRFVFLHSLKGESFFIKLFFVSNFKAFGPFLFKSLEVAPAVAKHAKQKNSTLVQA